jgi:A nuclease family of the HNH/ENDO VII superfamily with conserved AHH
MRWKRLVFVALSSYPLSSNFSSLKSTSGGFGSIAGAAMLAGAAGIDLALAAKLTNDFIKDRSSSNTNVNKDLSLLPPEMATQWGWAALALVGGGVSAGTALKATQALARGAKAAELSKMLEIEGETARALNPENGVQGRPQAQAVAPTKPAPTTAPNPNALTPEFIAAFKNQVIAVKANATYMKYGNWAEIKSLIGKPMSEAGAKAHGYLYATIEGKSKYFLPDSKSGKVPQVMENAKGVAYVPSTPEFRLANSSVYEKNLFATNAALTGVNGKLIPNSQIHHLIGDSVWRKNLFLQKMLEKGIGHMDESKNLIELATDAKDLQTARAKHPNVKFSDVIHIGSHSNFDELVEKILVKNVSSAQVKFSTKWKNFTPQQMQEVVKKTVDQVRDLFINHPDQLPKKANGTLGKVPQNEPSNEETA